MTASSGFYPLSPCAPGQRLHRPNTVGQQKPHARSQSAGGPARVSPQGFFAFTLVHDWFEFIPRCLVHIKKAQRLPPAFIAGPWAAARSQRGDGPRAFLFAVSVWPLLVSLKPRVSVVRFYFSHSRLRGSRSISHTHVGKWKIKRTGVLKKKKMTEFMSLWKWRELKVSCAKL